MNFKVWWDSVHSKVIRGVFFSLGKSHALNGRCDSTPRILTVVQPTKWNLEKFEYLLMFVYMFKDFFEIENYSYLRNANEN